MGRGRRPIPASYESRQLSDVSVSEHALLVVRHRLLANDVRLNRSEYLAAAPHPVDVPLPHVAPAADLHADDVRERALPRLVAPERYPRNRRSALQLRACPRRRLELLVLPLLEPVERSLPPAFLGLVVADDRADGARRRDLRAERLLRGEADRLGGVLERGG